MAKVTTQYYSSIILISTLRGMYLIHRWWGVLKTKWGFVFTYRKLVIGVDQTDDNYMPNRIFVYGCTESGQSKMLNETRIDW